MRFFASSGQAATSPAMAHSSSDEAGEIIENSHTRSTGRSVLHHSNGGKSRSLERYSGAPKIHPQAVEMLPPYATPTCSTRRRLLAPFRSLKRRSRSSSSSNESHHFASHLSNLVVVNVGASAAGGGVAKAKASSQSGDSGTGGTELEHEMEQDDEDDDDEEEEEDDGEGEELDELSLSYSQLSSSGCDEAEAPPEDVPDDRTVAATVAVVAERRHNILSLYSSSSEEQLHCRLGDITLVDDTYSNYDPQNEAERMFLQVVGILRDENEVCVLANSRWPKYWSFLLRKCVSYPSNNILLRFYLFFSFTYIYI